MLPARLLVRISRMKEWKCQYAIISVPAIQRFTKGIFLFRDQIIVAGDHAFRIQQPASLQRVIFQNHNRTTHIYNFKATRQQQVIDITLTCLKILQSRFKLAILNFKATV